VLIDSRLWFEKPTLAIRHDAPLAIKLSAIDLGYFNENEGITGFYRPESAQAN